MKIYAAIKAYDYEGDELIGVFFDADRAIERAAHHDRGDEVRVEVWEEGANEGEIIWEQRWEEIR